MIEFSGYISGAAKKFRQIKGAQLLYIVMGCVYLVLTPFAIALYLTLKTWILLVLYTLLIGLVVVYPLFPLDKHTEKFLPQIEYLSMKNTSLLRVKNSRSFIL